ncbi:MAG: hypothetical protein BWY15_00200 [Firmicutes bacterium ADurb.Bin193]|nr:MAG: hypothetical protein BWY15_00200 [Firmicutes bacterium ADurb.Bin193]
MKKAVKLLKSFALILTVVVLASCNAITQNGPTPSPAASQSKDEKYIITSEKYGFMLEAPKSWEDKVIINEDNNFVVSHKTVSKSATVQNPIIFTIVEYGNREKWEQDSKKENEPFPYEKLSEINGKVYAYILPFEFPYDDKTPEDLKQYTDIMNEAEAVLKTFKAKDKNSVYYNDIIGVFRVKPEEVVRYNEKGEIVFQAPGGHHVDEYFEFNPDGSYTSTAYGDFSKGKWSVKDTTITYKPDGTDYEFETEYDPVKKTISLIDIHGQGGVSTSVMYYYKEQPANN